MSTLTLKRNEAEATAKARRTPKPAAPGRPQPLTNTQEPSNYLAGYTGKPMEIRLSTGEILAGSFKSRRFDILFTCTDSRKFVCHKNQIVWARETDK